MLVFGSKAIKFWFPDFKREPKDIDYISKSEIMTRTEQHYWQDSFQYVLDNNKNETYVDPNFLYTIKVSHAAWDIFWDKTMHDIMFLKSKGCVLDHALYICLFKEWETVHRKKRINLKMKNEEFFTKNVTRKYDHDWLHQVLAFYEQPLHALIRPDDGSPFCSEKLWTTLSFDDMIKCALEEVYVVATERFIPAGYPPRFAKIKSLKHLITSMTKGWFNLFLIEHFDELLKYPDNHWLTRLEKLK